MARRISKSQRGVITLLVTVLLAICGLFSMLSGNNADNGAVTSAASTPTFPPAAITNTPFQPDPSVPTVVTQPQSNWWQVYFTEPFTINDPKNIAGSIEERLIERINTAQVSIHIASFEFDLTPVAEALIAAHNRGVDVRWVTDDEYGLVSDTEPGRGQFEMLQNAGIEVRADTRSGLMHNKFWIFDGQFLWTGSTNITKNGIFVQNNNVIVFFSPELSGIFEREFQEMWDGRFGPKSPSQLSQQSLILNGTPISVVFTSEDPVLETLIIPLVRQATSSVRFLAFSFTDYPLAAAMIERAQQGVSVAGVMDRTQSGGQGSELGTLFCAKVPVRLDGNPQFMHNKVIVVDERYVIVGSLNYSTSAEEDNDENVIAIDNAEIARLYLQEFDRVYSQGTDLDAGKVTCQ